jgi:hypothetical protein
LSLFELFKKVITELEIMEVTENKIPNVKLYNN